MGDFAVDSWKLEGRLHLWHYPKQDEGWEGWHLNADAVACQSIAELIDLMLAAKWKTRKRIPASIPERMTVGGGDPWKSAAALLLDYPLGEAESNYWEIATSREPDGVLVKLTVGEAKLRDIRESLLGLPHWKDDYALGPDVDWQARPSKQGRSRHESERLWFWTKIG